MMHFDKWCRTKTTPVDDWELKVLTADEGNIDFAVWKINEVRILRVISGE